MKSLKIKFPNDGEKEFNFGKPIILLGANGAGKTRFSIKIEELNDPTFRNSNVEENILIHRIAAQKSLSIQDSISILDYESSKRSLFFGSSYQNITKIDGRFKYQPATILLNDFNEVLSFLFAEENKELHEAHEKDKQAIEEGKNRPDPITTIVERVTEIWNNLLPHRKITLIGNGIYVNYDEKKYHGKEMSDGERVILYMICQVLTQRPNTLLIIDEPELHIHKSVIDKLWTRLEMERNDCIFMYITHDLDFALSRKEAEVIWIKNYNGIDWEYDFLKINDYKEIPERLLYEIIGSRQKILFVEGTKDSNDYSLYQEIYKDKDYHIIPCGGCQEVIRMVKAKKSYEQLNAIEIYGIVDRDFRNEQEITKLQEDGIYCLKVAEVENLFVVPEILDIVEEVFVCDKGKGQKAKEFIKRLFCEEKNKQITLALAQEMKYQLSLFELGKNQFTPEEIKNFIDEKYSLDRIKEFFEVKQNLFDTSDTVEKILKIFNFKGMSKRIGEVFGIKSIEYPQKILNILRNNHKDKNRILQAIRKYTPELP